MGEILPRTPPFLRKGPRHGRTSSQAVHGMSISDEIARFQGTLTKMREDFESLHHIRESLLKDVSA